MNAILKNTNEVNLAHTIWNAKVENKGHIFFLHGLFGNRYNLSQLAKDKFIADYFTSHLLDMRNHGESEHCSTMSFKEMALDIARYAEQRKIKKYILCGHSMGGKIAMSLAALRPHNISSIIVMDAPPKDVRGSTFTDNCTLLNFTSQ